MTLGLFNYWLPLSGKPGWHHLKGKSFLVLLLRVKDIQFFAIMWTDESSTIMPSLHLCKSANNHYILLYQPVSFLGIKPITLALQHNALPMELQEHLTSSSISYWLNYYPFPIHTDLQVNTHHLVIINMVAVQKSSLFASFFPNCSVIYSRHYLNTKSENNSQSSR